MKLKKTLLSIAITVAAVLMFNSCIIITDLFKYADLTFTNDLVERDSWGLEYDTYAKNIYLRDAYTYDAMQYYTRKVATNQSVTFNDVECNKNIYFTFELFYQDRWWSITTTAFTIKSDTTFSVYDCIYFERYDVYRSAVSRESGPKVFVKVGDQIIECTATPIEE